MVTVVVRTNVGLLPEVEDAGGEARVGMSWTEVAMCGAGSWAGGPISSVCASGRAAGPGCTSGGSRIGRRLLVAAPKNAKHVPVALLWFEWELSFASSPKLPASP